jgi:hypothetical protein
MCDLPVATDRTASWHFPVFVVGHEPEAAIRNCVRLSSFIPIFPRGASGGESVEFILLSIPTMQLCNATGQLRNSLNECSKGLPTGTAAAVRRNAPICTFAGDFAASSYVE